MNDNRPRQTCYLYKQNRVIVIVKRLWKQTTKRLKRRKTFSLREKIYAYSNHFFVHIQHQYYSQRIHLFENRYTLKMLNGMLFAI